MLPITIRNYETHLDTMVYRVAFQADEVVYKTSHEVALYCW